MSLPRGRTLQLSISISISIFSVSMSDEPWLASPTLHLHPLCLSVRRTVVGLSISILSVSLSDKQLSPTHLHRIHTTRGPGRRESPSRIPPCPPPTPAHYRAALEGGSGSLGKGDELVWQTNLRSHAFGEYSMAVVQANSSLEDQGQIIASPSTTYAGVFDGHGGPDAARFINRNVFSLLQKFTLEQGGLSLDVMRKTFETTEAEFIRLV